MPRAREAELARRRGRRVEHGGDGRELDAEAVVQDERDAFTGGQPVEDDLQRHPDGAGEGDLVGRVTAPLAGVELLGRHRHPGAEPVETQPGRHRGQPAREVGDVLLGPPQPQPRLLDDVLRLDVVAEDAPGDADQARPLGLEGRGLVHVGHVVLLRGVDRVTYADHAV